APAAYPEANMFGVLPAYGLYVRHADDLMLKSVDLRWDRPDARSMIVFDHVNGLDLDGFTTATATGGAPVLRLNAVRNALIRGGRLGASVAEFLRLSGRESADVSLIGNDLSNALRPFHLEPDVPASVLRESGNVVRSEK